MKIKTRYRIVTDNYAGFEAQYKTWWWPFWRAIHRDNFTCTNTNYTVRQAEQVIEGHRSPKTPKKFKSEVVKVLEP